MIYNIKIIKIREKLDSYISVVNRLQANESVDSISKEIRVSLYVIYQIKNGSHVIHQYLKKNAI